MTTADDLYGLLPAVHRLRDAGPAGRPGPLQELVGVLATQADVVDADLTHLADAWFIETCADWLVGYLGDLLGATPLHPIGTAAAEPRAYVARTLEYRQAKGTVAVLEQLARDVTGWPTRAVELFTNLAWIQHDDHVRLERSATADLHDPEVAAQVDGPFDATPRTVDVRRIADGAGRHNLPNIGLFVYRLSPQTIVAAQAVPGAEPGRWHVDPLGRDVPLFNPGRAEADLAHLADEPDLPGPLRRRPLQAEVEALRDPATVGRPAVWFTDVRPVVRIETRAGDGDPWEPVPPAELVICDLADWRPPPSERTYPDDTGGTVTRPVRAAVDPVLGRVSLRAEAAPQGLRTTHTIALPMPLGGGAYDRRGLAGPNERRPDERRPDELRPPDRRLLVGRDLPERDGMFTTLGGAVAAWRTGRSGDLQGGSTEIVLTDSVIHPEDLRGGARLELGTGSTLRIVAAHAPVPPAGERPDPAVPLHPAGVRPVLTGGMSVVGSGTDPDGVGRLTLEGVWLAGDLTVLVGNLAVLQLVDVTVVPDRAAFQVRAGASGDNGALVLDCVRTVTGPLSVGAARALRLDTAIVDAGGGAAVDAPQADVTSTDTTVLGGITARVLQATNTIFTGPVTVERRQDGCLRYCALPTGPTTRTPRRYRCQPDLAISSVAGPGGAVDPTVESVIRARMHPVFTSTRHGHPAYCQLSPRTAPEIATGADDGSEMGVYHALQHPARHANLTTALTEYLRAGMQAGALFVT